MSLLSKINSPEDLKKIPVEQLPGVAQEIRDFLIDSVSKTGGHLGPSLGVVELTIAMHYVFSTPHDKFIWDVGHQAYPHKIITGRREQFHTLRQYKGISGFPHITESEHDALTVGHASTSISAALGMAKARDLKGGNEDVIAVIGDGALTGGLAFEALNNLGNSKTKMTVILNDNEMSIAPNVGAVSKYLTKIMTDKNMHKLKDDVWHLFDAVPKLGKTLQSVAHNAEEAVKRVVTPGKFFEDLGVKYIGPIDGHDLHSLMEVLDFAKNENDGPLLIHVLTQKGKGYHPAEQNATKFHGIGSFEKDTGEVIKSSSSKKSYSAVFGETLSRIAANDEDIVAVTAAMPDGTGLAGFRDQFPGRLFDVGIAEGHAVTFSAGLALNGLKPVVAVYSTFIQRAFDHIVHDIALENLNVVICLDRAGVVGNDGPTHHGAFDMSFLRTIPNLTILAPSCGEELQKMLYYAIYEIDGPVVIRYPRGSVPESELPEVVDRSFDLKPVDKSITDGDTLLISSGHFYPIVEKAVEKLREDSINVSFSDARVVKPLDSKSYLDYFKKYKNIITFEQNSAMGGFGSAVLEEASKLYDSGLIDTIPNIVTIGYPDKFITQGSVDELMVELNFTPNEIADKVQKIIDSGK